MSSPEKLNDLTIDLDQIREMGDDKNEEQEGNRSPHQEAIEHVEAHRDLFEHYAHGAIQAQPAPEGLDTFAFDLKTNTIYINSRFYKDLGFSEEKTTFATLHEIEHFLEKIQMLSERGGDKKFAKYLDQIQKSKAFGVMDNCISDIRENRTVVERTHEDFEDIEQRCYREDLFPNTDFTNQPLHLQLPYVLLRERRVPEEICNVDPSVRQIIDDLEKIKSRSGMKLLDIMTHPDTPLSTRLALQNKYIWPKVEELLKTDLEKEKSKDKSQKGEGDNQEETEQKSDQTESEEPSEEKSWMKKILKSGKKDKTKDEKKEAVQKQGQKNDERNDPNEIFKDAYNEASKRVPNAIPTEEVKKAFVSWKKSNKESPLDRADKEYAEKLGVEVSDLKQYRNLVKSLEDIKNPETNESVIEELHSLISRIISQRRKPLFSPQYPVEEGDVISDPALLVSEVKSGNLTPKAWETTEVKERPGQKFGEVEITLVCDRSSSMSGAKLTEQRKSAVLFMEALKEFADLAEEEQINLIKPLEIRSEIYTFQEDQNDGTPIKRMSKDLSEKERIEASSLLASAPGGTTDFVPLESISRGLNEEIKKKILDGELKKIVIVFTDGDSNDPSRVKKVLENLRKDGVVAIGVGITSGGRSALTTYAPDAKLAESADKLPLILGDLLKEHLSNV